jgi:hypothetical protein
VAQQLRELTDDVVLMIKGDSFTVTAGPNLRATGWRGGIWVQYVPPTGVDEFLVEVSDGNNVAGFLIFPSENYDPGAEETQANYIGTQLRTEQGSVAGASTVTMYAGGGRSMFRHYETVALNGAGARAGGPIVYVLNEDLKVSENGLLCNDSDVNLAAAGVTNPQVVGKCCSVPADRNGFRLGFDLKF